MSQSRGTGMPANSGTLRLLAWIGVLLQAAALVAVLWLQRWNGAWTIGAFFVLSLLFLLLQGRVPSLLNLLVVLAAVVNAFGWSFDYFNLFVWYDEVVHLFSSFAVTSAAGYLAWSEGVLGDASRRFSFICKVTAIGIGLGILWEVVEMTFLDLHFMDTLVDLLLDLLGAAAGAWLAAWVIGGKEGPAMAR